MAKNKMSDLRDHLFDTIERLKSRNDSQTDDNEKIDIETAKMIVDVSDKLIDMWKVEAQAISIIAKHSDKEYVASAINNAGIFSGELKAIEASAPSHEKFR